MPCRNHVLYLETGVRRTSNCSAIMYHCISFFIHINVRLNRMYVTRFDEHRIPLAKVPHPTIAMLFLSFLFQARYISSRHSSSLHADWILRQYCPLCPSHAGNSPDFPPRGLDNNLLEYRFHFRPSISQKKEYHR